MMVQEGAAAHFAGGQQQLDQDDIAYSRGVIAPYLVMIIRDYLLLCMAIRRQKY